MDDDEYTTQPVEEVVAGMGITVDLRDGDLVSDVVVLVKVVPGDSRENPALFISSTEGMDWITQLGIVEAASYVLHQADVDGE